MNIAFNSIFLLCVLTANSIAQSVETRLTDAEKFSLKTGTLFQKEFLDIGRLKGLKIQVLKIKDLTSGTLMSALRFEKQGGSGGAIGTIDLNEIDDLSKAIQTLKSNVFTTSPHNYTEMTFKSKTDFEAGAYYANDKWSAYLKISRYGDGSVFLTVEDLYSLLDILNQAKQQM